MRDLPTTFSLSQRILHWAMVLLLLFNLLFPHGMGGRVLEFGFVSSPVSHVGVGLTLLMLAAVRLALRLIYGVPPEPMGAPRFFRTLARVGQWCFYGLFFAAPITGLMSLCFGHELAYTLHTQLFRPLFWTLIPIHIALAVAHQYLWKTDMLGKIIRG